MFRCYLFIICLISCFHLSVIGQRTETSIDFSDKKNRLILDSDNDMLFNTDNYYTAGIGLSYTNTSLRKTPSQLILQSKSMDVITFSGFAIKQRLFTPSDITVPNAIENDQPYSAFILATNYSVLINPKKYLKISNEIGIGIMGPAALGEEVQTLVHEIIGSPIPRGWDQQLQNTFLIDYDFRLEKGFGNEWVATHFIPFAGMRVGTLTNRIELGAMFKLGNKVKLIQIHSNLSDLENKFI